MCNRIPAITMLHNLDTPPSPKYKAYVQADFIEILCIVNPDRVITAAEILSRFRNSTDSEEDIEDNSLSNSDGERSDEDFLSVKIWFRYLKYRQFAFGESYPFRLRDNMTSLELKSDLDSHQKLYVYLLMASSLRHYEKRAQNHLGKGFEYISAEALKQYVGENAEVHIFATIPNGRYTGNKYAKIHKLAEDTFEELSIDEHAFHQSDTGDGGLDIVGWFPFEDETPNRLLIFGQCACGDDWETKQSSSDYNAWAGLIRLSIAPVNSIFIPYCFRDASGNWYAKHEIRMSLMIDRLRIMNLLREVESPLDELPSEIRDLIDRTLSFVEEL